MARKKDIFERSVKRSDELWEKAPIKNIDAAFTSLLLEATEDLTEKIEKLNEQNQKLEKASFALQWTAMILGIIAVFFGSSQLLLTHFGITSWINLLVSAGLTLLIASFLESRFRRIVSA